MNKLKVFLYLLMRDELPVGAIEQLMGHVNRVGNQPVSFENEHIAQYVNSLVERLTK